MLQVLLLRKEVIHGQLPLPMPCYDFVPVTSPTLGSAIRAEISGIAGSLDVTGGIEIFVSKFSHHWANGFPVP